MLDDEKAIDENEIGVHLVASPLSKAAKELIEAGQALPDEGEITWGGAVVLRPPLNPERLLLLFGVSDVLQQCVDAMVQNVDGYGWVCDPVMNLDADDAMDQVATALTLDAIANSPPGQLPDPPTEDEVRQTLARWQRRAAQERALLKVFFDGVCYEGTFADLRKRRTIDAEVIGWAGWEVIRNQHGRIVRLRHIPAHTMRLTECEEKPVQVKARRPTSQVTYEEVVVERFFRRIVQIDDRGKAVFFREYGDPRTISAASGQAYKTPQDMQRKERQAKPANEVLWFANYHPGSAYGQPRWHGLIPSVIGNRLVQDINVEFLDDSAIPRGLLLVSDGRIGKTSRKKLETFFAENKGEAHNRMAIVEAVTPKENAILEGSGRVQVQWVSLRDAQRDDATFSGYVEKNADKVGEAFRIPPLLRGKVKDFNRATALASIEYAEEQVFAPEREEFDSVVNRTLVADLGVRFWRFKSRGPRKHDPEVQAKVADIMLKQGVVVPAELRGMAEHTLGIDLMDTSQPFMKYPMQMILAGHVPPERQNTLTTEPGAEGEPGAGGEEQVEATAKTSDTDSIARAILKLKAQLEQARAAKQQAQLMTMGYGDDGDDAD